MLCALVFACFLGLSHALLGAVQSRKYEFDDLLPVVVESVSPFDNPSERYDYYSLPWPCGVHKELQQQEAGADLIGERARESNYQLRFRRTTLKQHLCDEKTLTTQDVDKFIHAIEHRYQFDMRVDDLLVVGAIGLVQADATTGEKSFFLLTHRTFNITYNQNRVITCHLSREVTKQQFVELVRGRPVSKVRFSFSVLWSKTDTPYASRLWVQEQSRVTPHQLEAHWLWIINSCMLIVLLTALFSMILLRVVKNDVARYLQLDQMHQEEMHLSRESEEPEPDETGWKRVQFDVFRPPAQPLLFSTIVGVGTQVLMITTIVLILATFGYFYPGNHGRIFVVMGVSYCFTAYVAGFVASTKLGEISPDESDWMWTTFATSCLFFGPFFLSFIVVNSLAIAYNSTVALPFGTIATCLMLWAFVTIPLTAVGAKRGANVQRSEKEFHVKRIPRPIPEDMPWYHNPIVQVLAAGFLPFMSIYVELGTLFVALWGHTAYTLFGILAVTFVILLVVTSFIVVLLCYFQLVAEDYRWWWMSICRGAGCSLFIYAYAIYYWFYQSHMSGALQGAMFFLYSLMISYAFALMLGAVGHWTSRWFVITIYRAIKGD